MIKMKRLYFIPFLPLLGLLVFVNIYGDAGNRFHNLGDLVAQSLLAGNPTYIASGNLDERGLKFALVKNMPTAVDCLAFGPSTIMCVSSHDVGEDVFFNLGESNSDFYDILALFGAIDIYEKQMKRVIFCVDANFFSEALYNSPEHYSFHIGTQPYAEYMITFLKNGGKTTISEHNILSSLNRNLYALLSLSYFQSNISYYLGTNYLRNHEKRYGIAEGDFSGGYYMPDGSLIYPRVFQNNGVNEVLEGVAKYDEGMNKYISPENTHISITSQVIFEKLVQHLLQQEVSIELFLCPLPPALWDKYDTKLRPILPELEEYAHELAKKYSLKITGSYNPYKLGIPNEAFYDARHVRRELLSVYFDFKP